MSRKTSISKSAAPRRRGEAVMNLRMLRDSVGKTQGELAHAASMTQSQLSRIERRTDHLISTIRKYVGALGGQVEICALIKGRRIVLRDV